MTLTPKGATLILLAVVLIVIIVVDTIWALDSVPGNTISEVVLTWARQKPISIFAVGMAIGVVFGHLLWPQPG